MKLRVITAVEAEEKYGEDYEHSMGFASSGAMSYCLGRVLDQRELTDYHDSIKNSTQKFHVDNNEWTIRTRDVVPVSTQLYIRDRKWFEEHYGRVDFWEASGCIFTDNMLDLLGRPLRDEDYARVLGNISECRNVAPIHGWTVEFQWLTDVEPHNKFKPSDKKSFMKFNEIVIHRNDVEITITQQLPATSGDIVYFIDEENGETVEVPKGEINPSTDGATYVVNALNSRLMINATGAINIILKNKGYGDNHKFNLSYENVKCDDLDSLLHAIYDIRNFTKEYEVALFNNRVAKVSKDLTINDLRLISDEYREIQRASQIFKVEAEISND